MTYPGNRSLSKDIQDRIQQTFQQTLELAAGGNRQEAILGCDFILRMDPLYQPARTLLDRLNASTGAVDVSDLRTVQEQAAPAQTAGFETAFIDVDRVETEGQSVPTQATQPVPEQFTGEADFQVAPAEFELPEIEDSSGPEILIPPEDGEVTPAVEGSDGVATAVPGMAEMMPGYEPGAEAPPPGGPESADGPPETAAGTERPTASMEGMTPPFAPGAAAATDQRITELLDEGQRAFERSEYQAAIDAWSRIFLIDIDHAEAARRIDLARKLKAELERKVEEVFHEALSRLESGQKDEAKAAFEKVLEMQPNHLAAREYLEQIEAGDLPPSPAVPVSVAPPAPELSTPFDAPVDDLALGTDIEGLYLPPGEGHGPAVVPSAIRAEPARSRSGRSFFYVGSLVLLAVLVGGWFLWTNWGELFPNSEGEQMAAAVPVLDPFARATKLHVEGKTALAIAQLRRLPADDPNYEKAQLLIAQWQALEEPEQEASESGPTPEEEALRGRLLEKARQAYSEKEYLLASRYFEGADTIQPLEGSAADLRQDAVAQLEPLAQQLDLYQEREWDFILPTLWRKLDEDRENRDVARLLVNSYYNLGVRELKRSNAAKAGEHFREALSLDSQDDFAERLYRFSQTYRERPKDLLFRIFVKHLRFRR